MQRATAARVDVGREHAPLRKARAAAIASMPLPVPISSTRRGGFALMQRIEREQAAAGGAVMAGAEGERGLDLDADPVARHPRAVMRAMDDKTPGIDRGELGETGRHPVARGHALEHKARRGVGGLLAR